MSAETAKIAVSRLYNDENGESHFIDETLEVTAVNFAPPAPPIFVSEGVPAKQAVYLFLPAGYVGDFHPAPRRQIMTLISGLLECGVSDGTWRTFTPGNTQLVEDTQGKGHATKALQDCVMIVSQLD
ncbi:hypothetical protein ACWGHM_39900 [Streptomyces sp. NPDC054904]|uniref:hypothetical protein n=1 Tax=unclassified Streptomyces TaxID=2593676 RepID=UPI002481D371|nr:MULTISPECIES: hypothetical protein [unclassified Streptomyces]MDA5283044.1 hypothetical protein [Streptomyces sp. Isolate_45]MDX2394264.1 hypothetical protein [Streptomyces sp. DK15]